MWLEYRPDCENASKPWLAIWRAPAAARLRAAYLNWWRQAM